MDRETETILVLAARTLKFATDHPYAATGIFGAAVGSAVTYKVMTYRPPSLSKFFTPKVYELALPASDLHQLLNDPSYEMRWEMKDAAVIVTGEKREPLRQLPDITIEVD